MSLPRHTVGVTLNDAQLARLDELAYTRELTRSEILMVALACYDQCQQFDTSSETKCPPSVFKEPTPTIFEIVK